MIAFFNGLIRRLRIACVLPVWLAAGLLPAGSGCAEDEAMPESRPLDWASIASMCHVLVTVGEARSKARKVGCRHASRYRRGVTTPHDRPGPPATFDSVAGRYKPRLVLS